MVMPLLMQQAALKIIEDLGTPTAAPGAEEVHAMEQDAATRWPMQRGVWTPCGRACLLPFSYTSANSWNATVQQMPTQCTLVSVPILQVERPVGIETEAEMDNTDGRVEETFAAAAAAAAIPDQELMQLQQLLLTKLEALPSLRARMDQAEQRLSRVLGAVEVDQGRTPPHTVERALLNRRLGTPTPDDTINLSCPSDATRKRLAAALFAA
ncbi:MAG: hypothetical protein WDW36_006057 [Sanguina aurantia]